MSLERWLKKGYPGRGGRRTHLGAAVAAAALIVVVIVGVLIVVKGVGSALAAIFSGCVFIVILALYWLRNEGGDVNANERRE
jgi:heme A synthase